MQDTLNQRLVALYSGIAPAATVVVEALPIRRLADNIGKKNNTL